MQNIFKEFQQLSGTWRVEFYQDLMNFVRKLKNNRRVSDGKDQQIVAQVSSVLNQIENTVSNYQNLYTFLCMATHTPSNLTQSDLRSKLTPQDRNVHDKETTFLCFLLLKRLYSTLPEDIEGQKLIAGIFGLNRFEAPLIRFLGELEAKIADKFRMKDNEINTLKNALEKANSDLEANIAEKDQIKTKLDEDVEIKEEKIKALEKANSNLEAKIAEIKTKLDEKTNATKMKDEEITALKRTQVEMDTNIKQLEENCEKVVREKKAVEDESNSIKNCYYLYYLLIRSLEDEQKESKMKREELEAEKNVKILGMFSTIQNLNKKIDVDAGKLATKRKTIKTLSKKNNELTATVNNKNEYIQRLGNVKEQLTKRLQDKKTKNLRLKQDIKTERNKSNDTERRMKNLEKRNAKLMSANEEIKKEASEDVKDVIKTCRVEFDQVQRKIENRFYPTVTKSTGFLMELYSAEMERATRAPRKTRSKPTDNKRKKRRRSESDLTPNKLKRQKKE